MSAERSKAILIENSTDAEVFQDMDKFEIHESKDFTLAVKLQFPKFSKGFTSSDFDSFIQTHVGEKNVVTLGRLAFPNEWQLHVKSNDIRERLIRLGRTKINSRTCWISPLSQSEVRGYVHWIPNAFNEVRIRQVLEPYGEVLFVEVQKNNLWTHVDSDTRYFALNLKPGQTKDDIPHFFKIKSYYGLITIKGRSPSCFHCKRIGHRKTECPTFKEKLASYSNREPGSGGKRLKPRGKRYRPMPDPLNPGAGVTSKRKKKKAKSNKADQTLANASKGVNTEDESQSGKEAVKAQENSAIIAGAELTEVKELFQKLSMICNGGSKGMSKSSLKKELFKITDQIEKYTTTEDTEKDNPLDKGEESAEEKKKKRKKKKKKKKATTSTSEASPETTPPKLPPE